MSEGHINHERVAALIDEAGRSLERESNIKRFHTQAKSSIDAAAEQVSSIVGEVAGALEQLARETRANEA